jgi:hypothetical protein
MLTEARQEGEAFKICPVGLMILWVYNEKFLVGTQFLFRTLMFTVGQDGNLKVP